jgi:hypothetical protein
MTSTVDLLDAIYTHLTEFELPAFASVHVATPIPGEEGITVQLACHDLPISPQPCWPGPTLSPRSPPKRGGFPRAIPCTCQ